MQNLIRFCASNYQYKGYGTIRPRICFPIGTISLRLDHRGGSFYNAEPRHVRTIEDTPLVPVRSPWIQATFGGSATVDPNFGYTPDMIALTAIAMFFLLLIFVYPAFCLLLRVAAWYPLRKAGRRGERRQAADEIENRIDHLKQKAFRWIVLLLFFVVAPFFTLWLVVMHS